MTITTHKMLVLFLSLWLWVQPQANATVYEISPSGSDANPCTASLPCKSLAYVCAQISSGNPGTHTINMADGAYAGGCSLSRYNWVFVNGNNNNPSAIAIDPMGQTRMAGVVRG